MNNTENTYCRLCAKLKPIGKLTDVQNNDKIREEIVDKLKRLNLPLNFENILPRTVCLLCINSLNTAYDFVAGVVQAQVLLKDLFISPSIKKEAESSDSENFIYEAPEETYDDNIDIKLELDKEETNSKLTPLKISKKILENKQQRDLNDLDGIPLSQLKLTWNDYSWMCAYCETLFPNVSELRTHSMEYHKTCSAYKCTDCNRRKLKLDSFLIHVRRHRKHLKLSCYKCPTSFISANEANKHKTIHLKSEFYCSGCNTAFSSTEELNAHTSKFFKDLRTRKVPQQGQHDSLTCLLCKKKFKNKTSLNTHLLIHTERKRDHTCEVCGKCFLHKQNLAGHLMIHDDKKPFQCEICKTSFRSKSHLRRHVGVHDGEKPFSCGQCGKNFRLQKQLKSHSIIHTDSLPYICSYCNKRFRFKTILNQHIRQHTGVKPYSCNICQRDFTNWPNYNKHMKRRHSMDMAKKKHTPEGLYPIDPATGQVVNTEKNKMLEWKNKLLEQKKPGRPRLKNGNPEQTKDKNKSVERNNN